MKHPENFPKLSRKYPEHFLKIPEIYIHAHAGFYFPKISLSDRLWSGDCTTGHGNFLRIFLQCTLVLLVASRRAVSLPLSLLLSSAAVGCRTTWKGLSESSSLHESFLTEHIVYSLKQCNVIVDLNVYKT
jgi:hypothetical protein